MDQAAWPEMKDRMRGLFLTKTRDAWTEVFEGTDVCFAPVLSPHEAYDHPHNRDRSTFVEIDGTMQPAPAPRFSRTPAKVAVPPPHPGRHTEEIGTCASDQVLQNVRRCVPPGTIDESGAA